MRSNVLSWSYRLSPLPCAAKRWRLRFRCVAASVWTMEPLTLAALLRPLLFRPYLAGYAFRETLGQI